MSHHYSSSHNCLKKGCKCRLLPASCGANFRQRLNKNNKVICILTLKRPQKYTFFRWDLLSSPRLALLAFDLPMKSVEMQTAFQSQIVYDLFILRHSLIKVVTDFTAA